MRTEHMFVLIGAASKLRVRKIGLPPPPSPSFSTDRSKTVPLLQFLFVSVSHMWLLSLFVPHLVQQRHNATTTSLRRRCNVTKLQRRCNDVDATLCVCWAPSFGASGRRSFVID